MRKLFKIAKREYLDRVRRKSFLIGTILGPILMGGMIIVPGLLFNITSGEHVTMAVVDRTDSLYTDFASALDDTLKDGTKMFLLKEVQVDERNLGGVKDEMKSQVTGGLIDGYLIVPPDIMSTGKATFYGKKVSNVTTLEKIEKALDRVVMAKRLAQHGMEYDAVQKMMKKIKLETVQITKGEEKKSNFENVFQTSFIFIMILYMTILMWGVAVERSIIEEKNNRIVEVLLSSVRPFDILGGKILGVGAVGLTQYAIWAVFTGALAVYALSTGMFAQFVSFTWVTLLYFILYYLLGFLFYSTIFAGIGSICNTDQEAQQLQTPVVMALAFTIIIPIAIMQKPDGIFATVVSMIPFFTPIVMFMRINILTPPAWQIVLSVVIMLLSIYVSGLISAKIFRVGILMYGKRPQIKEVLKWLRRA